MSTSDLASLLIAARRSGIPIPFQPELEPASFEAALAVSANVAAALGESVAGWKVGHMRDGRAMAAPMFASGFRASGARFTLNPNMPLIPEVEVAVRLARDLPRRPERPYRREEILNAVSEVLIGLELIARRYTPESGATQLALIADDLGNCGYVLGPARAASGLDLASVSARFRIGEEWRAGRPHPKGDPLLPLIDWASQQCDRLGGLRAGQIVTLGSLTPMIAMHKPAPVEGEIEGLGSVAIEVVG